MANYQEDDMDLPNTQILDDRVLKDVVAYVEVRSTNDNRTKAICKELENLGAMIKKTFTDDVTHVVYKEGCKRTRTKAQKRGVYLVSVLWVDSCKQNQEHVSERLYPATLPDDKSTPILLTKLKKMKSMQPRDFDEDVANSAERCTKRKRKVELLKIGKDSTPCNSPGLGGILVMETQPRSPEEIPTPLRLTIPDTPPSMRARLKELRKNNDSNLPDTSLSKEADQMTGDKPLIRKLFNTSEVNMEVEEEDPLMVLNRAKSINKTVPDEDSSTQVSASLAALETSKLTTSRRTSNRRKSMSSEKFSEKDSMDLSTRSSRRRKSIAVTSFNMDNKVPEGLQDEATNPENKHASNVVQIHHEDIAPVSTEENMAKCKSSDKNTPEIKQKITDFKCNKATAKGRRKSLVDKNNTTQLTVKDVSCGGRDSSISIANEEDGSIRDGGRISDPSPVERSIANVKAGVSRRRSRVSDPCTGVTTTKKASALPSRRGQRKSVTFSTSKASIIDQESAGKKSTDDEQQYSNISKIDTDRASVNVVDDSHTSSSAVNDEKSNFNFPSVGEGFSDKSDDNLSPPVATGDNIRTKLQPKKERISKKKMLMSQDSMPSSFLIEPTMKSDKVLPTLLDNYPKELASVVGQKRKVTMEEGNKESHKKSRKGSRSETQQPQASDMFSDSDDSDKSERHVAPVRNIMREILENNSALSASGIQTESVLQTTGPHGMSLSTVFGDETMTTSVCGFAPPRPSIDEFNLKKIKSHNKTRKKALSESSVGKYKKKCSDSEKSSSDSDGTGKSQTKVLGDVGSSFRRSPHRPSIVMTSLHSHEQDSVIAIVKNIGHFVISDNVSDTTSHVICGGPRRTLNLLYAVSRGSWILHQKWVYDSLDAGQWLPEEEYEVTDWFPSVKVARLQKESLKENYKSTLFSGEGIMFVAQKTSPPRSHLCALIKLCGGQVTMSTSKAQIIVGNDFYPDRTSVSPLWILDCIIQQRLEPMEAYLQGRPKRDSSPEF
ncbi:microcephalin-like [Ylistrum balloti]|uniref:microcephalin-like n=1 Tax=Ylistrum balloti TaxID=509963 RepID=UPI002905C884|nr:microcephalin-like [Ylistrum balloti]